MRRIFKVSIVVLGIFLGAGTVFADFYVIPVGGRGVGTKLSALPTTISTPGFYYLTGDLTSAGSGITVNADNVTIDMMGFSLIGPGSGGGSGIYMNLRSNVEIRNGTVRDFYHGIIEANIGQNHRVINVRAVGNRLEGISLAGDGHLVKDCTVSDNEHLGIRADSGCTVTGNTVCHNGDDGIRVWSGCTVIGNTVYENEANGIRISLAACLVDRNTAYSNNQSGGAYTNITSCPTCTFGLNHAP